MKKHKKKFEEMTREELIKECKFYDEWIRKIIHDDVFQQIISEKIMYQ